MQAFVFCISLVVLAASVAAPVRLYSLIFGLGCAICWLAAAWGYARDVALAGLPL